MILVVNASGRTQVGLRSRAKIAEFSSLRKPRATATSPPDLVQGIKPLGKAEGAVAF